MLSAVFALRGSRKRPATPDEMETTRPFYKKGNETRGKIGILFIHGFTVTPANFRGYAESLAADGYTVSIPLLPGHAGTSKDLLETRWQNWLAAVLQAYDRLRRECEEISVAGISLGGALALQLAVQRDDVKKLFLLAPAVYPTLRLKIAAIALIPLLRVLGFRYWTHVAGDVKRADGFELGYGKTALRGLLELSECMVATQRLLPEVTADILIFQGRTDHEIPARKAEKILRQLGSRRKELIWLDNSYHEVSRDHDSQSVLNRIREEIARLPP